MSDFSDQWPIAKFVFRVTIKGSTISFQEVSGLDQEAEILEYRHGKSKTLIKRKRTGLIKTSTISFKKGVFKTDDRLLSLFNEIYEHKYHTQSEEKLDLLIELLDEGKESVMTWNVSSAIPIKIGSTDMKSDDNSVAIESIDFAHEGITLEIPK